MNRNPNGYNRQNNNFHGYGSNSHINQPPVQHLEKPEQPKNNFEALLMKIIDQKKYSK